jgi:hypothetical protein
VGERGTCPVDECILNPVITQARQLPTGTSVPNTVITERAVKAQRKATGVSAATAATSNLLTK